MVPDIEFVEIGMSAFSFDDEMMSSVSGIGALGSDVVRWL